jgi:hypothetical protein
MEDDTPLETSFANQSPSHTESKAHTISPATIIGRPTDISVMRGSTAVLKTDFIGEPLPEIKWDKGVSQNIDNIVDITINCVFSMV